MNDLGKQIRERLNSPFVGDVKTIGRAVGAGVGLAESDADGTDHIISNHSNHFTFIDTCTS